MVDILALASGMASIADKVFSSLSLFRKASRTEREKLAALCDQIAVCNQKIAESMSNHVPPREFCSEVQVYSQQLPERLGRFVEYHAVGDLKTELEEVYATWGIGITLDPNSNEDEWHALSSVAEAAAGKFRASANILRAM